MRQQNEMEVNLRIHLSTPSTGYSKTEMSPTSYRLQLGLPYFRQLHSGRENPPFLSTFGRNLNWLSKKETKEYKNLAYFQRSKCLKRT
jgi:hypothetical protein